MLIGYVREENRKDLKDYDFIWVDDASLDMKMKDIKEDNKSTNYTFDDFVYVTKEDESRIDSLSEVLKLKESQRLACQTPTNKNWTLRKLMSEIDKEPQYFKLREELVSLCKKSKKPLAYRFLKEINSKTVSIHRLKQMKYQLNKE